LVTTRLALFREKRLSAAPPIPKRPRRLADHSRWQAPPGQQWQAVRRNLQFAAKPAAKLVISDGFSVRIFC
jgi:hypothetical protein